MGGILLQVGDYFSCFAFCFTQLFFRYASFTTAKSVDQERKRVKET